VNFGLGSFKTEFSKPMGLVDKDVLILDPACGTGTFLFYVIRQIYDTLCSHGQKGQWNSYVSENLLKRIFGFELLMAPYAVAHLKLGLQLQELGYKSVFSVRQSPAGFRKTPTVK
jgi:predicted helicase